MVPLRSVLVAGHGSSLQPTPEKFAPWSQLIAAVRPHGNGRSSRPRAARSHSASVGRRPPAAAQYADASDHSKQLIGSCSSPLASGVQVARSAEQRRLCSVSGMGGCGQAPWSRQRRYAATVASCSSRQNPLLRVTSCTGCALAAQSSTLALQPRR